MEFGLTILIIVLWFGLLARKAWRKALSDLESEPKGDTAPQQGTVKSAFDSLFDTARETVSNTWKGSSTFAKEASEAGYFSYESSTDSSSERPVFKSAPKARPVQSEVRVSQPVADLLPEAPVFDLRQAVIYQTILSNKYISDMHPYDN